tara:strand:- start:607 stop:1746 length:1140 start_codon:yes stop_codon:yes gene_type:complete
MGDICENHRNFYLELYPRIEMATPFKNTTDVNYKPTNLGECIVEQNLIDCPTFKCEVMETFNTFSEKTSVNVTVYPIEAGNLLELKSKESELSIPLESIIYIGKDSEEKGGFRKKNNEFLTIKFRQNEGEEKISLDFDDKKISEFLQIIKINSELSTNDYWDPLPLEYESDDSWTSTEVFYRTPFLARGEEVLWINVGTKGTFTKKAEYVMALTNFRAMIYRFNDRVWGNVFLISVDDVTVMNSHRVSQSTRAGSFSSVGRYGMQAGSYGGVSSGKSQTVGDVVFMVDGKPIITWGGVTDPNGIKRVANAVRKNFHVREMVNDSPDVKQHVCTNCGNANSDDSKFCNSCGTQLGNYCPNCNKENPDNAAFCNKCGSPLK